MSRLRRSEQPSERGPSWPLMAHKRTPFAVPEGGVVSFEAEIARRGRAGVARPASKSATGQVLRSLLLPVFQIAAKKFEAGAK
jgi:hypothetical protein